MKKILSWLIALAIMVVLSTSVEKILVRVNEHHKVQECKPTQQERLDFEKLINENAYYYYNSLNSVGKEAYITIYWSFMSLDDSISLKKITGDLNEIYMAVLYDNPQIFWVDNFYKYFRNESSLVFTPEYLYSQDEIQKMKIQLNDKINEVVSFANTLSSDYEKELYIHDYVCANTVYDYSLISVGGNTAYDSLVNGKAICEGYAKGIKILLDAVQIDNYLIFGDAKTDDEVSAHMWNIVKIDNANYHLDATWNDQENLKTYFYFNISDKMIENDHFNFQPENNFCTSSAAYYYIVENTYIESYNGFYNQVYNSAEKLRAGNNSLSFVFENTDDYKQVISDIENNSYFYNCMFEVIQRSGRQLNPYKINCYKIDENNYLCIKFEEE